MAVATKTIDDKVSALYHMLQTSMVSNLSSFSSVPEATPVIIEGVAPGVIDNHCLDEDCCDSIPSILKIMQKSSLANTRELNATKSQEKSTNRVLREQESSLKWLKTYSAPIQVQKNNEHLAKRIGKILSEILKKALPKPDKAPRVGKGSGVNTRKDNRNGGTGSGTDSDKKTKRNKKSKRNGGESGSGDTSKSRRDRRDRTARNKKTRQGKSGRQTAGPMSGNSGELLDDDLDIDSGFGAGSTDNPDTTRRKNRNKRNRNSGSGRGTNSARRKKGKSKGRSKVSRRLKSGNTTKSKKLRNLGNESRNAENTNRSSKVRSESSSTSGDAPLAKKGSILSKIKNGKYGGIASGAAEFLGFGEIFDDLAGAGSAESPSGVDRNPSTKSKTGDSKILKSLKKSKFGGLALGAAGLLGLGGLLGSDDSDSDNNSGSTGSTEETKKKAKKKAKDIAKKKNLSRSERAKNAPRDARGRFIRRDSAKVESAEVPEAKPSKKNKKKSSPKNLGNDTPNANQTSDDEPEEKKKKKIKKKKVDVRPAVTPSGVGSVNPATLPEALPGSNRVPPTPPTPPRITPPSGIPPVPPSGIPPVPPSGIPPVPPSGAGNTFKKGMKLLSGAKLGGALQVVSAIPTAIEMSDIAMSDTTTTSEKVEKLAPMGGGMVGGIAGAAAGGKAGAAAGGLIGAAFGGVGAVPGALIGGILGSIVGGIVGTDLGTSAGEAFNELNEKTVDTATSEIPEAKATTPTEVEKVGSTVIPATTALPTNEVAKVVTTDIPKAKLDDAKKELPITAIAAAATTALIATTAAIDSNKEVQKSESTTTNSNMVSILPTAQEKETPKSTESTLLGHAGIPAPVLVSNNTNSDISSVDNTENNSPINFSKIDQKAAGESDFLKALATIESNANYDANSKSAHGAYQLGNSALIDSGYKNNDGAWTGKNGATGLKDFMASQTIQDGAATDLMKKNWANINSKPIKQDDSGQDVYARDMIGKNINGVTITESGLLGASHIGGAGSVRKMLRTDGLEMPVDYDGVPIIKHMQTLGGKDVSYATSTPSLVTSGLGSYIPDENVDYQKVGSNTSIQLSPSNSNKQLIYSKKQYEADSEAKDKKGLLNLIKEASVINELSTNSSSNYNSVNGISNITNTDVKNSQANTQTQIPSLMRTQVNPVEQKVNVLGSGLFESPNYKNISSTSNTNLGATSNTNLGSTTTTNLGATSNNNKSSFNTFQNSGVKSLYSTDIIGTGNEGKLAQDIRTSYSEDYKKRPQEITRYAVDQQASPKDIALLGDTIRETITEREVNNSSTTTSRGSGVASKPITFENVPMLLDSNIGLILINGSIL